MQSSQEDVGVNEALTLFFTHQLTMKMFHFQTPSGFKHAAADNYMLKYTANFDRFMEAWQGANGRLRTKRLNFAVVTKTDESITDHLDSVVGYLSGMNELPVDLSAIRDEMVADIHQLKYLLTFQ